MVQRISVVVGILALACCAGLARAQSVVAMVTDVAGDVRLTNAGKSASPTIATALVPGMRIDVGAGGALSALDLASGDELLVVGPASIELGAHGLAVTPSANLRRKTTQLGPVKLRQGRLAQAALVMRSSAPIERLPLLAPVDTVILDTRPKFRWSGVGGARSYRFELLDDAGNLLYEARTSLTELELPEAIRLVDGKGYTWEISTRRPSGARFESVSDFSVASRSLRDAAEQLRPESAAPVSEWASYAVWLEGQGLGDTAREAWARIAKARPNDAAVKVLSTQ